MFVSVLIHFSYLSWFSASYFLPFLFLVFFPFLFFLFFSLYLEYFSKILPNADDENVMIKIFAKEQLEMSLSFGQKMAQFFLRNLLTHKSLFTVLYKWTGEVEEEQGERKRDSKLCLFFPPITLTLINVQEASWVGPQCSSGEGQTLAKFLDMSLHLNF